MWGIHNAVRAHKARRHFQVSLTSIVLYSIFQKGIYKAVLPVREKTIGVIAIVEMCGKCSHFRLMLAVEETKTVEPEMRKKYFVTKKTLSDRRVGIHLSLHESCGNLHSHLLLSKQRIFFTCLRTVLTKKRGFDNSSFCGG